MGTPRDHRGRAFDAGLPGATALVREQATRWALTMNGTIESGERIAANVIKLI
jgi:hypothetical protein